MDPWVIVTGVAVIIGIVAGIVQVLDYLEKRRKWKPEPLQPTTPATSLSPPAIPSNLPPRGGFIGREKEKARVREALASRWPLICIDGIGGIGKTALALEVAVECLQACIDETATESALTFDGFIWTSAKDRELILSEMLDTIARTLDYPGIAQEPLEEKQELVRERLRSKRYLLIVDNFETVTDNTVLDFLLRLPEPTKALITSREQNLPRAWAVSLKGMEQSEALALIRTEGRRLGLASLEEGEEKPLLRLYQSTGGVPLAIKWAVGQIKQKGQSLDGVLAALHAARGDIFEEIFARSWSLLSDEAQHILMVMPSFATSASRDAIEAATDLHHHALDEGMGQLVEMRLVEVTDELDEAKRRYSVHSLTRSFAQREAGQDSSFIQTAQGRLASWLLELIERIGEDRATFDRLEIEFPNILRLAEWCQQIGQWHSVIRFRHALLTFAEDRGHWDEALKLGTWAIEAAKALNDERAEAWCCYRPFGWIYRHREELTEARHWYEKGLSIFERQHDDRGISWAQLGLGDVAWRQGDHEASGTLFEAARVYAEASGDNTILITALIHLSRLARARGDFRGAEVLGRKAHKISEEIKDLPGQVASSALIAKALLGQGKLDEAEEFFVASLQLNEANGIRHGIAWNKAALAEIEEKRGNLEKALLLAREANELHDKLGMKREMQETRQLLDQLERQLTS
jgi:tetratricopeptide (TPR) repeat protein